MSRAQQPDTPTLQSAVKSLVRGFALGAGSTALAAACVVSLYLAKSAAGIDLLDGHSPLHAPLYHLVK